MNNQLATQQKCVVMRNGIEVWLSKEGAEDFEKELHSGAKGFVPLKGRTVNTADILGVFPPEDMEDLIRRKNREWKCKQGNWHNLGEKCNCVSKEEKEYSEVREARIKECGKCTNGWEQGENGMRPCECVKELNIYNYKKYKKQ